MIRLVKIVHPEAGETEVPASSVSTWRRAGWKPAEEVAAAGDPASQGGATPPNEPPANPPAEKESKASGRPRRQPNEESE